MDRASRSRSAASRATGPAAASARAWKAASSSAPPGRDAANASRHAHCRCSRATSRSLPAAWASEKKAAFASGASMSISMICESPTHAHVTRDPPPPSGRSTTSTLAVVPSERRRGPSFSSSFQKRSTKFSRRQACDAHARESDDPPCPSKTA